jgi:hypothetical protein
MKLPRAVIFTGAVAAVLIIAVVASALLLSWLVDRQLLKQKISSELAAKTGGSVVLGKIAVLWFPRPTVVVENAEISFGPATQGSIRTLKIYPSILYLLIGQLVVRRADLQEPRLSIHVSEPWGKRFDPELWEEQVRTALGRLTRESSAPRVDLSDGAAEIRIGHDPPVILLDVAVQTAGTPDEVRFELSARSNLCERLQIQGSISPENLASELDISVQQLKLKESLTVLPLQIAHDVQEGEASFDVKIASVGLRRVKALIRGSAGPLVFAGHSGTARLAAKTLKGGITYERGLLEIDVQQLDLSSPRLEASGSLKVHSGTLSARIKVRRAEIAEVSELALRIANDSETLKSLFRYVPAGTIAEMNFHSAGHSFTEMASIQNIFLSASMVDCRIVIPRYDLEFKSVGGSVRIAHGILEADKVTANLGTAKGWNGRLRLGLEGKTAPFHLDIWVRSTAPDLQSLLLKIVHDEPLRRELLKVRNIEGELSGRLILGETLDVISPLVVVSQASLSATYESVPFPIAIRSGRFTYDQKVTRLESAQGSVGRSTFVGLDVTLHHDGSRQMKVNSGGVSLDLQQTEVLVRSFKDLRSHFEKVQAVRGRVELQDLALAGAYDESAGWAFASAGLFDQVEITHADFPGRITLSRGKFAANQQRIIFSDGAAAMLDAALTAGGTFEYKKGELFQFETSGIGTIGAQMTQWLSRYVELPKELELRSPLKIAQGRLTWRSGGHISFHGNVTAAGGPQLSLEAVKSREGLAVQNLTIDDGDRHARIKFQLAEHNLDLSFTGELTHQTIEKIFASFPTQDSSVRGEIEVSALLENPMSVSARGQLDGSNLMLSLGSKKALVETFSIEASGKSLLVRSADLRWGESRLTASGKVGVAQEILRVDVDVTGDQLDWEELQRFFGGESKQWEQKGGGFLAVPDVEGTVRLKTDRFTFKRFNLSPFETTAAISPSGIRAEIDRAIVCGIALTGRVNVVGNEIGLDLQLAARGAQLEPATVCLTNRQNDATGTYSLTARVLARGERRHLLSALQGNFELTAYDGEFIRSPGIDATFDYLNATRDFKVAFPDLDRQTLPYRVVAIKGRIDGEILTGDEIVVHSSRLNLSGHGKVDLARKQIEAKVLVAVLGPVDDVISRAPLISSIVGGGSLVAIPVRVSGSLERPDVSYLLPADIGAELLTIPLRILGMPIGAMRLFTPAGDPSDKKIAK